LREIPLSEADGSEEQSQPIEQTRHRSDVDEPIKDLANQVSQPSSFSPARPAPRSVGDYGGARTTADFSDISKNESIVVEKTAVTAKYGIPLLLHLAKILGA